MFKRKNNTDQEELPEKRTRLSGDGSDDDPEDDTTVNANQSTVSPLKGFLGKFIPNLSWNKKSDNDIEDKGNVSERGDNNEASSSLSTSRTSMSPKKASSVITNCKGTVILEGKIKLKNKWTDDLLESTSEGYQTMTQDYIKFIDELLHNSNVSKVYMNSVVTSYSNIQNTLRATRKSPGTVMVHSEMTFHHTYTKLFKDLDELSDNVEDFILLQSSLGETDDSSIQIDDNSDSVTVRKKDENTEKENEDENILANGHSVDDIADEAVSTDTHVDSQESPQKEGQDIRDNDIVMETQEAIQDNSTSIHGHQMESQDPAQDSNTVQDKMESVIMTQQEDNKISDGEEAKSEENIGPEEGEQIVVGNKKIIDVVNEPDDLEATSTLSNSQTAETKQKSPTDSKKSQTAETTQKSSTDDKKNKPSGSGLKSKSSKLTEDRKKKESEDEDGVPSEPSVPIAVATTSNSITLKWNRPKKGAKSVDHYEIKYKECKKGKGKWISVLSEGAEKTVKVKDLKAETEYEFKVRAVNEDGEEGPFSQLSVKLSTVSSLARSLIPIANLIEEGHPKVYKLPLTKHVDTVNERAKTRKCVFGTAPENYAVREKTIMVVGATGSGKTTLVDGMINYITDVSWEDEFRFSLVDLTDDEKKRKASESESQTEWITCYTINKMDGSTIDYTLNIIDTPGFGDTRGIVRDKRIVDQIREFFTTPGRQGISCLDAVCFVTQAPLGKLTPPQRYIFDQILSVFGQDIKSNIFVLVTFADANEPPVRAALKAANVPYQKSFKFNNSALYASPENPAEAEMGNLFWKMGKESFKIFFDELRTVESKSLVLTSEVLQLRKRLEATIQGLQQQIADGMNKLNTIKQEREILKRHKEDIKAKKDFTYAVDEVHMFQVDLEPGVFVTNCMTCNRTCHFPCGIPDDQNKQNCAAMDHGLCTVCPMTCHWSVHKNNSFRFDTYTMKVTKTYEDLKQKYEVAQKEAEKHKCVLGKVKMAFTTLGQDVMKMVHDVRCYINKLNDIALRPNPLSDKDYIDLLIESEKSERKYGWEQRIKLFYKLRDEAELVEKMNQQNYQPWVLDDSDNSDDDMEEESAQDNTEDEEGEPSQDNTEDEEGENVLGNIKEEPDMEM